MKKLLLFLSSILHPLSSSKAAEQPRFTIEAGPEVSHITYKEPGVMEEKGLFYGLRLAATYRPAAEKIVLGADGRVSYGKVDYSSPWSGSADNISDNLTELRLHAGYELRLFESSTVTPYIGFGYRYLRDAMGGKVSTIGLSGYDREQTYYYMPIGIRTNTTIDKIWSAGASIEYDFFLSGRNRSEISDVITGMPDMNFVQDDGYGLRGTIRLERAGSLFDLLIEPYINYWHIEDSALAADLTSLTLFSLEPENTSTEFGLRLQFKGVK